MDDDRADTDKPDEVLLPGFRFHPTDEELISFYLRRKIQQRPLSVELIRQLDIYKYDPWDLPTCEHRGEGMVLLLPKGTDRPVYSSEGAKCIGLKKSLVFYKGRAAKGIKTDWMMHEYRLPSLGDPSRPNKTPKDKNIPANDAWAICRVFKKPNSVAQRVLSRSWGPASIATADPELLPALQSIQASRFALETSTCSANRFNSQQQQNLSRSQDGSSCKVITFNRSPYLPSEKDIHSSSVILPLEIQSQQKSSDVTSALLSMAPGMLNSANEAIPNTEFGLLGPSNGYPVEGLFG